MPPFTQQDLLKIRDQHESWLRSQPGVVGTGVGLDKGGNIALKVFTNHITPEVRNAIYDRLADVPMSVEEIGEVRKQTG